MFVHWYHKFIQTITGQTSDMAAIIPTKLTGGTKKTRAITEGPEILVRDGSFKEEWGTTEVIIEGNKNKRHIITAASNTPGTSKYQYTYRSEITGLYNVASIIDTICEKHNIMSEGIMAACDGLNAIKNLWTPIPHICFSQITPTSSQP